jgi:hypothetical protein
MTPIKLMFFLIAATFLCCCNETKPKKVEKQQIIPATDTIPPINKKETTKIIKKIPPKKPRKIIQRVRNEDKKNRNDTIVKSASDNKIPAVWEKTFSSDKKWMELYSLSKISFITGWKNEFDSNPNAAISEFELLYAYRSRMEKVFYQTPEFIEFGVQHLASDSDFISFKKEYHSHIKPD